MRTLTVTSDRFLELGRLQARTLGIPELPLAVIPHPLAGVDPATAGERGRGVGHQLVRMLGAP